jgi:O-methyltransferase
MRQIIRTLMQRLLASFGYRIQRYSADAVMPVDFSSDIAELVHSVQPFTMTTPERIYAIVQAAEHITKHDIPGDIVECGVWRGGSMMAAAHTLVRMNAAQRTLWLFDTFEGMTAPTNKDRDFRAATAAEYLEKNAPEKQASRHWAISSLSEVKQNLEATRYPEALIRYIQGKVEDTIPQSIPQAIAILRLDTNWYESTKHELEHLFPRISTGGILILNDYGHWAGAKEAVDEYISKHKLRLLLCRIDYTGRIAVKQS